MSTAWWERNATLATNNYKTEIESRAVINEILRQNNINISRFETTMCNKNIYCILQNDTI